MWCRFLATWVLSPISVLVSLHTDFGSSVKDVVNVIVLCDPSFNFVELILCFIDFLNCKKSPNYQCFLLLLYNLCFLIFA